MIKRTTIAGAACTLALAAMACALVLALVSSGRPAAIGTPLPAPLPPRPCTPRRGARRQRCPTTRRARAAPYVVLALIPRSRVAPRRCAQVPTHLPRP